MSQGELGAVLAPRAVARPATQTPLSQQLWGLDWSRVLPWAFEEVTAELATFEEALPFVNDHYGVIFGNDDPSVRFLHEPMTPAKARFYALTDVFMFRAGKRDIGLVIAHPSDWSTYYCRTGAILPEYRARYLLTRFVKSLYEPLRAAGVSRLETESAPSNLPIHKAQIGDGYMVTGTTNTERWGAMLRLTKFLSPEAEAAFLHQFCVTPR